MLKVVHLTSAHSPTDSRIFIKECQSLAKAGYETILVAPHGVDEIREGVKIRSFQYEGRGRLSRMTKAVYRVYRMAISENADLYHFHDPELIPIGIWLQLLGYKVIYDAHEDLPRQILAKEWIWEKLKMPISKVAEATEDIAARIYSGVIAATPKIAEKFPTEKTVLVQNFPIIDELVGQSPIDYDARPNRAIYIGGISRKRGAWEMVRSLSEVDVNLNAKLKLAGEYKLSSEYKDKIVNLSSWRFVEFEGWLNRGQLKKELRSSRVGLVVLHPTPNYIHSQPIKLFEYMAAGLPVIASDFPLWRDIITEVNCGLLVDPLDPKEIGEAIEWILKNQKEAEEMGKRGRRAVVEKFNWKNEKTKLLNKYKKVIK